MMVTGIGFKYNMMSHIRFLSQDGDWHIPYSPSSFLAFLVHQIPLYLVNGKPLKNPIVNSALWIGKGKWQLV